jgi:hypothetical protein
LSSVASEVPADAGTTVMTVKQIAADIARQMALITNCSLKTGLKYFGIMLRSKDYYSSL